ncbi:hypothetical protein PMAYCL1PPCAC_07713, partial [Pristionchus mayeri]
LSARMEQIDKRRRNRQCSKEHFKAVDVVIISKRKYDAMRAEYEELKRFERNQLTILREAHMRQ